MNKRLLLALLFVAMLTGCGNKGPLVLPEKPQSATEPQPTSTADPQPATQQ